MGIRCVNCGARVSKLLVQYSPGNIRLMKCESCMAVADPYVECEFMILLIDLVLHKRKAYRHLLFNMLNQDNVKMKGILWKACIIFFMLDMFRHALLGTEWDSSRSTMFLLSTCGKMLLQVSFGNSTLFCFIFLLRKFLLNDQNSSTDVIQFKDVMLAVVLSSYFKIFLITMMVWEFPSSVALIIDVFVISSNTVAFKVLTQLPSASCVGILLGAHGFKFLVSTWLQSLLSAQDFYFSLTRWLLPLE